VKNSPNVKPTRLLVLNLSLVMALFLSFLPLADHSVQAAPVQSVSASVTEESCFVAGVGERIFLPLLSRPGTGGVAPIAPAAAVTTERSLRYDVGKTYTYRYELAVQSRSTSQDAEGSQSNNGMAIGVSADVDVAITAKDATGVFSGRMRLRNVILCAADITGAGTLVGDEELLTALAQPIFFKQANDGVISEVTYPQASPATAVNLQKGLLNSLQITLKPGLSSYSAEESGGQGAYTSAYVLSEGEGGLNIARTFNQDGFATLLYSGDENEELLLQNTSTIFLDGPMGVLRSVKVVEEIVSADQSQTPPSTDDTADGATATSSATTQSSLILNGVADTPAAAAVAPTAAYVTGGLGVELSDDGPFRPGIDSDEVDLAAEFNALEGDLDNPALAQRLSDLIHADEGTAVLDMLKSRLEASSANEERAKRYIDVLGIDGTPRPEAVALLLPAVQKVYGPAVQEHALIGLIMLRTVHHDLVEAVQRIANDSDDPMHGLSLLVLGAIVEKIEDPTGGTKGAIKLKLRSGLRSANDDETRILYLDAIGNAGDLQALSQIQALLDNTNPFEVREAAIQALRKLPAENVEEQLISLLSNPDEDPELREIVANVLRGRKLSQAAVAALAAYDAEGGLVPAWSTQTNAITFKKSWNKHLGGSKLGIDLPGSVSATEKTNPNSVSLVARQEAVAHAWSFKYNIALAELLSQRKGDKQELKVTFSLLNNKIKKTFDKEVECAYNKSANLYKATHTLIDFKTKIPVWGAITVDLGIRATGSIALDFSYNLDVCNLTKPLVAGSITPSASATLEGYAALSIQVLRGGAAVSGTLLNTSIPAQLTAKRVTNFELCIDIKVKTKPLTIAIKLFAERRKLTGGWKRFFETTLFKYDTPQKDYPLLVSCLK
jgi:hypothetical protein